MHHDPRARKQDTINNISWTEALHVAVDLIEDEKESEYERGIVEFLADMSGNPGMLLADRINEVRSELEDTREEQAQSIQDEIEREESVIANATERLNAAKAKQKGPS